MKIPALATDLSSSSSSSSSSPTITPVTEDTIGIAELLGTDFQAVRDEVHNIVTDGIVPITQIIADCLFPEKIKITDLMIKVLKCRLKNTPLPQSLVDGLQRLEKIKRRVNVTNITLKVLLVNGSYRKE